MSIVRLRSDRYRQLKFLFIWVCWHMSIRSWSRAKSSWSHAFCPCNLIMNGSSTSGRAFCIMVQDMSILKPGRCPRNESAKPKEGLSKNGVLNEFSRAHRSTYPCFPLLCIKTLVVYYVIKAFIMTRCLNILICLKMQDLQMIRFVQWWLDSEMTVPQPRSDTI